MSGMSHEEIHHHKMVYLKVFGALAVLTVVTVLARNLHVSIALAILIALIIAAVKSSLVAGFFMHLVSEKKLIYWVLALCVVFFLALLFIPTLTFLDHAKAPPAKGDPVVAPANPQAGHGPEHDSKSHVP